MFDSFKKLFQRLVAMVGLIRVGIRSANPMNFQSMDLLANSDKLMLLDLNIQ